jgi:hypothetical protein
MRTVWLALFCLIGLATTAVVKMGISPYANADVSRGGGSSALADASRKSAPPADVAPSSETETIATNTQSDALTKGDRLEVSYTEGVKSVKSVVISPAETEPTPPNKTERIVSRHWHDPLDNRGGPAAIQPSVKHKLAKANATRPRIASEGVPKP